MCNVEKSSRRDFWVMFGYTSPLAVAVVKLKRKGLVI